MTQTMYRYREQLYSDGYESTSLRLELEEFNVVKETRLGKWITPHFHGYYQPKKFVLNNSHKRYAHETKAKALESFIARKERQIEILASQLGHAKHALNLANVLKKQEDSNAQR